MEDVNKSPKATMKLNFRYPINEIVAWGIFGDKTFLEPDAYLYSNHSESIIRAASINKAHLELMDSIEQDIKKFISENSHKINFSTIDSTITDIKNILDSFFLKRNAELTLSITNKNTVFKVLDILWATLIIAYREMALFAFDNDNFYVAMQLNESCRECQAQMMFKNIAFIKAYQKKSSEKRKKDGSKGGSQKGINYSKPQQKALDYHDKYLDGKNEKGKYVYSNDKASRKIIDYFVDKKEDLGYEVRSLSNIISRHRNKEFND